MELKKVTSDKGTLFNAQIHGIIICGAIDIVYRLQD